MMPSLLVRITGNRVGRIGIATVMGGLAYLLWRYEIFRVIGWEGLLWAQVNLRCLWPISALAAMGYAMNLHASAFQIRALPRLLLWWAVSTFLLHSILIVVEGCMAAYIYEGYSQIPMASAQPIPWYLFPLGILFGIWVLMPALYLHLSRLIGGQVSLRRYLLLVLSVPLGIGLALLTAQVWPSPAGTDLVHTVKAGYAAGWVVWCFVLLPSLDVRPSA